MPSIFGSELRARFGGYKPSRIDHARASRAREGACVCGLPVAEHFDADNRKLTCEEAAAALAHEDDAMTTCPTCGESFLSWQAGDHECQKTRGTCDVCRGEIPADAPLPVLPDGSVVCSTTCELNWYEARR